MRYIDTGSRDAIQALGTWLMDDVFGRAAEILSLRWQSGFVNSAVLGIFEPALRVLEADDGVTRLLIGSNDGVTTSTTVSNLLAVIGPRRSALEVGVVSFDNAYFHPKAIHLTRQDGSQAAYVGSANLTGSGVSSLHVEAGMLLDTSSGDDPAVLAEIAQAVDDWFSGPRPGFYLVRDAGDVARLVSDGVIDFPQPPRPPKPKKGTAAASKTKVLLGPLVSFPGLPAFSAPATASGGIAGAPGAVPAGAPTPPAVPAETWSKSLTTSDAQRKSVGNQRGSITLVQAPIPFSTATYFKDRLFVPATWTTSATRTGRPLETASITFEAEVLGNSLGSLSIEVTFDPNRASGQNNYTTLLHLGPLAAQFATTDLTGRILMITRMTDNSYQLSIS